MIDEKLKPTNDLLLIRRVINEQPKTASGILLPPVEESADTPYQGVVVAAGPGKSAKLAPASQDVVDALQCLLNAYHSTKFDTRGVSLVHWERAEQALKNHSDGRIPMQVKVGDTVVFSKNGFQEFKLDGETLIALGEASVMGVLEVEENA